MGTDRPSKPLRALGAATWVSLALAAAFGAVAAWQLGSSRADGFSSAALVPISLPAEPAQTLAAPRVEAAVAAAAAVSATVAPPAIEVRVFTEGELRRGETLASALDRQGLSAQLVHEIATVLRPVFDFRYARAGDRYRLAQDEHGRVLDFEYRRSEWERYTLHRDGEGLVPERIEPAVEVEQARIAGAIATNLYDAVDALGESGELAHDFAEIFAWDVDFSRSVRPGDEFHILYERRYLKSEKGEQRYVGAGRILAARYSPVIGEEHSAIYYEQGTRRGGYYRADGSAVERQFLQAPLTYRRISSTYSTSRVHPITGRRRPHLGIDYAAASGTPVWAVANGRVTFRGWLGGLGKTVKIRHENGFESWYGHLSRFPNLSLGQHVRQKQVVGYVGSTGLSTGPHLHFLLKRNGQLVNPSRMHAAAAAPIPEERMKQFAEARDGLLQALDARALRVVTNEAL
jgi:murein DD-endopeptidase MepM/ murein hydrolase activator NlpD